MGLAYLRLVQDLPGTQFSSEESHRRAHAEESRLPRWLFMNLETGIRGRSPPWSRDELILAMNLYLAEGLLDDTDPRVTDLSARLQGLGVHAQVPDPARFRNPNGVALKLANFASLDPAHAGVGMRSIGKGDREVWDESWVDPMT